MAGLRAVLCLLRGLQLFRRSEGSHKLVTEKRYMKLAAQLLPEFYPNGETFIVQQSHLQCSGLIAVCEVEFGMRGANVELRTEVI